MKRVLLLLGVLLLAALPARGQLLQLEPSQAINVEDGQDMHAAWFYTSAVSADHTSLVLTSFKDLNNDGDWADTSETTNLLTVSPLGADCTAPGAPTHFACSISLVTDGFNALVWKNSSSLHLVGNYTIRMLYQNAANATQVALVLAVRIHTDHCSEGTIIAESCNTLLQSNLGEFADSQDVMLEFRNPISKAALRAETDMKRYADLNGDGDLADTGETSTVIAVGGATPAAACATSHFSCTLSFQPGGRNIAVARNATFGPGNYTVEITMCESSADCSRPLARLTFTFRVTPGLLYEPEATGQHVGTRSLINTSYANLTTFGVPCASNCSAGSNATINLSAFTTDCHGTGTNLCINGHVPNLVLDQSGQFILILGAIIALAWLSTRKGSPLALIGFFGSVALTFLLFTFFNTATQSRVANEALLGLAVMVMCLGPAYYALSRREERQRAFEEGEEEF